MKKLANTKAYVELFHLLFLEQLGQKLDKRLYAVKGGCNLRFFLGSVRYSEDIDFDIHTVAPNTLKNSINKILSSISFEQVLKTREISIMGCSAPKQTATTQRWKVQIKTPVHPLPINTKIEFSRRDTAIQAISENISREIILSYKLRPIFISHYDAAAALKQKIKALIHRSETQARDVFDIYHLIQTNDIKITAMFSKDELDKAIDNAMGISFAVFKAQVISYLEPEYQAHYNDSSIWDKILVMVCECIGKYAL